MSLIPELPTTQKHRTQSFRHSSKDQQDTEQLQHNDETKTKTQQVRKLQLRERHEEIKDLFSPGESSASSFNPFRKYVIKMTSLFLQPCKFCLKTKWARKIINGDQKSQIDFKLEPLVIVNKVTGSLTVSPEDTAELQDHFTLTYFIALNVNLSKRFLSLVSIFAGLLGGGKEKKG